MLISLFALSSRSIQILGAATVPLSRVRSPGIESLFSTNLDEIKSTLNAAVGHSFCIFIFCIHSIIVSSYSSPLDKYE